MQYNLHRVSLEKASKPIAVIHIQENVPVFDKTSVVVIRACTTSHEPNPVWPGNPSKPNGPNAQRIVTQVTISK
eukprot:m.49678 g.49678  ORF g.49678 m.49678 type:complete len:74 (+) comp11112_c0_seq5:2474-2695(+)